jgi:Fe-S cluster biogenesis protein NfuA
VTGLAERVTAVLERSVLSSVIARGASVRVAAATGGVVTLEVTGSPGAVFPLASRIEALIRAAVPEITTVRMVTPGTEQAGPPAAAGDLAAAADLAAAGDLAAAARRVLDAEVNPMIAAHRGHVAVEGAADGWIRIRLEGGCQGCGLAEVTVRQGIEPLLRSRLPAMTGLIDATDHEAGTGPFFSTEKR